MGAIILSKRDLSDDLNRTQARYELNRAIDTNDTQALADWAKNWGEAALARTGHYDGDDAFVALDAVWPKITGALHASGHLLAQANKEETTVADLKEPIRALFRRIDAIDDLLRAD